MTINLFYEKRVKNKNNNNNNAAQQPQQQQSDLQIGAHWIQVD